VQDYYFTKLNYQKVYFKESADKIVLEAISKIVSQQNEHTAQ